MGPVTLYIHTEIMGEILTNIKLITVDNNVKINVLGFRYYNFFYSIR
jgi:hypothetical protein